MLRIMNNGKQRNRESFLIRGVRIIDPAMGRDEHGYLFFRDGVIEDLPAELPSETTVIEGRDLVAAPAFIDLHVHLRDPGHEASETIESGTRAAARGGFGTVVAMPNTSPPMDTPDTLTSLITRAQRQHRCTVLSAACITAGRLGSEVAPLEQLSLAGAVAFTDDGSTVADEAVMREAMERAAALNIPIMDHAQNPAAERNGVIHAGKRAEELGLPGIPAEAEVEIIDRDLRLAGETGCALHIQHLSAGDSVSLLRHARSRGVKVTAEITPHHLMLCEDDIPGDDALYKMNPPLRTQNDRQQLRDAIAEGVIDCFATDHAPHPAALKAAGFLGAPFGVVGLETAVGVTWTAMGVDGTMNVSEWVRRWTIEPAIILQRPLPSLSTGQPADIVLLDLNVPWRVDTGCFLSRSWNSCFHNRLLTGRPVYTFHRGTMTWKHVCH